VLDAAMRARLRRVFPWATLVINVTGSLLLGVVTGLVIYRGASSDLRLIIGTGFCGGYTTFSASSFETIRLAQRGSIRLAVAHGLGTLLLTVGAAAFGLVVVR
ncbi:MAG TPA: CrcB family protein, partial [Jatrophihabitans sp.]|nr:CrcB family protein [Jatrophihabitans sp.]